VGRFKTKEQALASIPGGDFAKPDEPTRRAGSRQSLRSHVAGSTGNFNERPYPKAEPKSLATMTIEEFLDWLAPIEHQWNLEAGTVSGYGR